VVPLVVIEKVNAAGSTLVLSRRGDQFSIRTGGVELMNSQNHASEDELGRLTCARLAQTEKPTLLVGGLGLGFTLRAALDALPPAARVEVVEIVPEVVRWNRTILGPLANHPLDDPRTFVIEGDVAHVIRKSAGRYDAILLDVDNGPDGVFKGNKTLYERAGLVAALRALTPNGVLAVWSSFESPIFTKALQKAGFEVELAAIRPKHGGPRHCIWFARALARQGQDGRGAPPKLRPPSKRSPVR